MNIKLQLLYEKLERERNDLLNRLATLPPERLEHKAAPTQWSVNEILIHLLTSEQLTLAYLKKKSLGLDQLANSGVTESLMMLILQLSQRLPLLKYKAPKDLVAKTPEVIALNDLKIRWDSSRIELKNFLETIHDKNLYKLVYKHPVAGRFDIIQCLKFMSEHFLHHLPQIKRLL
jgi:DinB superfamily